MFFDKNSGSQRHRGLMAQLDAVAEIYKIGENHFPMAFAPSANRFRLYEIRK